MLKFLQNRNSKPPSKQNPNELFSLSLLPELDNVPKEKLTRLEISIMQLINENTK